MRLGVTAWRDAVSGTAITRANLETRGLLPHDVAPGEDALISMTIPTPPTPGAYRIECDFVSEQAQWFSQPFSVNIELR